MIFGIDLGTTNSVIGFGNTLLTGLVPSNVDIVHLKQVDKNVVSENVVSSYKTNMSMGSEGQLSIRCSSVILKELAEVAGRRYGEKVEDVVISVPAYFSTSQREAVYKAATSARLNLKSLINEPTAAALYVCGHLKDLIVVYDLGGGTFDISIVDSRMGTYSVIATDGKVLGGDDLDKALLNNAVVECKVPMRHRSKINMKKMQVKVRQAKEEIQKTNSDVFIDFSEFGAEKDYILTEEKYKNIVYSVFEDTVDMTNFIISKNIPVTEKPKVVFVGGSSNCPYLKAMVLDEIGLEEVKSDINPDLIVAKGVALYAELLSEGKADAYVEDVTKRLCIEDDTGRSVTIIESNSIVPCRNSVTVSNAKGGDTLSLRLYQGSSVIAKDNDYVGTLIFEYGRFVEQNEGIVEVTVEVSADGVISLIANEVLFGDEYAQKIKLTSR